MREQLLWPPARLNNVHSRVRALVCAEGQAEVLRRVDADFGLREEERDWLRRGRKSQRQQPMGQACI